jgi:hypothetical protein
VPATQEDVVTVDEPAEEPVEDIAAEIPAEMDSAPEAVDSPEAQPAPSEHEHRASAANAARLLSQFSEDSVGQAPEPEVENEPEPDAPPAAPEGHAPRPRRENGLADTAALLRELSSLGTETTAPAPRTPLNRPPAAPAVPSGGQHARKRKGLFGRN